MHGTIVGLISVPPILAEQECQWKSGGHTKQEKARPNARPAEKKIGKSHRSQQTTEVTVKIEII